MIIIVEDRDFINDLEHLQYEVESRKAMIKYALEANLDTESFQTYQDKYLNYFKAYEQKKQEVETKFVKPACPNAKNWNLNFATGELTITE